MGLLPKVRRQTTSTATETLKWCRNSVVVKRKLRISWATSTQLGANFQTISSRMTIPSATSTTMTTCRKSGKCSPNCTWTDGRKSSRDNTENDATNLYKVFVSKLNRFQREKYQYSDNVVLFEQSDPLFFWVNCSCTGEKRLWPSICVCGAQMIAANKTTAILSGRLNK